MRGAQGLTGDRTESPRFRTSGCLGSLLGAFLACFQQFMNANDSIVTTISKEAHPMRTAFLIAALMVSTLAACEERVDDQPESTAQDPNQVPGRQPGVGVDTTITGAPAQPSPAAGDVTRGATPTNDTMGQAGRPRR